MSASVLLSLDQAELQSAGGKAAGLRRLIELGLPVPKGFWLPFSIYRQALPPELPAASLELRQAEAASRAVRERLLRWQPAASLRAALEEAWVKLGSAALVVRSSASCEDSAQPSAGLFASFLDVHDLEDLLEAVRRCWASLWEVPAWAGLRLAGRWPGGEAMAVILQIRVEARWAGLLLSRNPVNDGRLRVEAVPQSGAELAAGELDPEVVLLERAPEPCPAPLPTGSKLDPALLSFLQRTAAQLERGLGGAALELEWAYDGARPWLLQVRPTRARSMPRAFPVRWRRPEHAHQLWRWDREHNPDPLSPAHQSLIELLEDSGVPGMMVQNGYLYAAAIADQGGGDRQGLASSWQQLGQELDRCAEQAGAVSADSLGGLERALACFGRFYSVYAGPLAAARRRARAELRAFLAARGAAQLELELLLAAEHSTLSRTEELCAAARRLRSHPPLLEELRCEGLSSARLPAWLQQELEAQLRRYGSLTARWDLAAPTLAEQPERLLARLLSMAALDEQAAGRGRARERAAAAAASVRAGLAGGEAERFDSVLEAAQLARSIEEDDDLLFSRALVLVRRAWLRGGADLASRGCLVFADDVFWLTIDETRRALADSSTSSLAAQVEERRRSLEARRQLLPPVTIEGDRLAWLPPPGRAILHGAGVGGLARGVVHLARSLEELMSLEPGGAVVVCPTLLPSLAVVLAEAAALVTDHGGLLSHAASLARELGVPAVVGTGQATRELRPGETVWVDGTRGMVVREV